MQPPLSTVRPLSRARSLHAAPAEPAIVPVPALAVPEPTAQPGPDLRVVHNPFGAMAERFRVLRGELALRLGTPLPAHGQVLAVVGAERGVGRSFVAANLAASMAQRGGRVLLVDADLRSPGLHRLFGLRTAEGLASMLCGRDELAGVHGVASLPALHLLPAGAPPAHPLELIERAEFAFALRRLRLRFSHIVLDTSAGCDGPDAALVAAHADAALVVVQRHRSPMDGLLRLRDALHRAGTSLAGAVVNDR
jgi:capsular exopolysaccharide synthesis family protein